MTKKRLPKFLPPLVLLVLAVAIYFMVASLTKNGADSQFVSGTIEAVGGVISPEIGGKVTEIMVNEGDVVKAGETLFVIDDTLLQAQRNVAQSALDLAQSAETTAIASVKTTQTNFDLILSVAMLESSNTRAADWRMADPEGYTLPGGSFRQADFLSAAEAELDAARTSQDNAEQALLDLVNDSDNAAFFDAEKSLLACRIEAQTAQDVLTKASTSGNTDLEDNAQTLYDDAFARLEDAQTAYDDLVDSDAAEKILAARRDLVLATERVAAAQSRLAAMQTGENSLKVLAAEAVLDQAQAAAAQAGVAVNQARANLNLLDTQIAKLTVHASVDGIVLTRSIELGEVLSPGAPAITIGQLDPLTITVYVPESEVGLLSIGQTADLLVDSFPEEVFQAKIIHIADQAEFTPRNVQTTEGRKTTVFAVKLQMDNPDGKLKPGMPADIRFLP